MKSYETLVVTLYEGIISDAIARWTDLEGTLGKDLSYLRSAYKHRGLAFFTLTLPEYGHWIDLSLDHGSFVSSDGFPLGIPVKRKRGPLLFQGLLSKVFDPHGMLRSDSDPHAVLLLRTLCQSFKKLQVPVEPSALRKTLKEFFDVESNLPESHPDTWDCQIPVWRERFGHPLWGDQTASSLSGEQPDLFGYSRHSESRIPWDTLLDLSRRVTSELGTPEWWTIRPKHGPGVTSEPITGSKYEFGNWPEKLELFFPYDWFGSSDLSNDFVPDCREIPSRLIAVPKTAKGPRLICAEPSANQWIQQGIWDWLKGRIPKTVLGRSIDFESQERSKELALSASRSGLYATIDLSAASDRLSTRLVEYIFQGRELLDGMHACRTQSMAQDLSDEFPKLTKLRKFATMGSALTFPIQSIVFTILTVWALRLYEGREDDWTNWKADFDRVRVFGDDIIVPTHAYGITKFVLSECGLLVNSRKSFGGLHFRESCGMDAFKGVDVTPPRCRLPYSGTAPSTAALVEWTNNLHLAGLWYASDRVLGLLPEKVRKLLFVSGPSGSRLGLVSFCGSNLAHLRKRWDKDLQSEYVVRLGFYAVVTQTQGSGRSSLLQFFYEDPAGRPYDLLDLMTFWKSGKATTARLRFGRARVYV